METTQGVTHDWKIYNPKIRTIGKLRIALWRCTKCNAERERVTPGGPNPEYKIVVHKRGEYDSLLNCAEYQIWMINEQ